MKNKEGIIQGHIIKTLGEMDNFKEFQDSIKIAIDNLYTAQTIFKEKRIEAVNSANLGEIQSCLNIEGALCNAIITLRKIVKLNNYKPKRLGLRNTITPSQLLINAKDKLLFAILCLQAFYEKAEEQCDNNSITLFETSKQDLLTIIKSLNEIISSL